MKLRPLCLTLLTLFAWLTPASTAPAQMTVVEEETNHGTRLIYKMTITPAKEPLPAFKYRFTTPLHKTINGNAITHYLRAFGEGGFSGWRAAGEEIGWDEFAKYYSLEPGDNQVDLENLKRFSHTFDNFVTNHLRRATLCRDSDWGLGEEDLRGADVYELLLPSVQQMRNISRMLALRTRLAIREGRFDDAVDHMRMAFQLGRNTSEMKILVTQLVSIAICGITEGSLKEIIATPGSPNLYWALAELPRPLISIRDSMQLELSGPMRVFPTLEKISENPHMNLDWESELQRIVLQGTQMLHGISVQEPPSPDTRYFLGLKAKEISVAFPVASGLLQYSKAKKRLARYDFTPESIEQMSVSKVLLLDAAYELQRIADELNKGVCATSDLQNSQDVWDDAIQNEGRSLNAGCFIGSMLLPASLALKNAETRLTWQLNALQNIEAIRMHVADHGSLPTSLQEIKLHLPDNPFTEKPYEYRLRGKTAVLEMPFGQAIGLAQRFELTLAK